MCSRFAGEQTVCFQTSQETSPATSLRFTSSNSEVRIAPTTCILRCKDKWLLCKPFLPVETPADERKAIHYPHILSCHNVDVVWSLHQNSARYHLNTGNIYHTLPFSSWNMLPFLFLRRRALSTNFVDISKHVGEQLMDLMIWWVLLCVWCRRFFGLAFMLRCNICDGYVSCACVTVWDWRQRLVLTCV